MNLLATLLASAMLTTAQPADTVIVDSEITLQQALEGTRASQEITRNLRIIDVEYYGFDDKLHAGQVVMHQDLERDIVEIFAELKRMRFPVESVIPIRFDLPDDGTTMDTLNNCCGFHYRVISTVKTSKLSNHAYGRAIDINPYQNPAILKDGTHIPPGSSFEPAVKGTIAVSSPVVKLFLDRGWEWGGTWRSLKDYMHFEKQ